MTRPHQDTRELKLAEDFVRQTGKHVFLTGKAGTGKTTFLHNLKSSTAKRMIVTAPTGVAAINAGGVTLHSFFQLPFGPFLPGSETQENSRQRMFRFSREKLRIIRSLDLLVIDEISMVRSDLLDSVDAVLRRLRRSDKPFGGIQLLMIGDLFQLPPVVKPDEWQLLSGHYDSPYFFSSKALGQSAMITIELTHIFRQSDTRFIKVLNSVRDNRLDAEGLEALNQRVVPDFTPEEGQGYITLTTHNRMAEAINTSRLDALGGDRHELDAAVSGDFPDHLFPTPKTLAFKKGAQVMFLRNDASGEKRYFNGKIGRIKAILKDEIRIVCPDESGEIAVEPVQWENIKYFVNDENKEIEQEIIGRFTQFPLKLAWAITIHKSQGLTFEKAVIDAQAAFAQGQVYVALSRCRSLKGLVLRSPIPEKGIRTDRVVVDFVHSSREKVPTKDQLKTDEKKYQQELLLSCFDFNLLGNRAGYFFHLLRSNASRVTVFGISDPDNVLMMCRKDIVDVGEKFKKELLFLFEKQTLPAADDHIRRRTVKASAWFGEKLQDLAENAVRKFYLETDNKTVAKQVDNAFNNFRQELAVKLSGVRSCRDGFAPERYLRAISDEEIDFTSRKTQPPKPPEYGEADIQHPELLADLKEWRSRTAKTKEIKSFQVLHQRVLIQIAASLPATEKELAGIKGIGKKTMKNYGEKILVLVKPYLAAAAAEENGTPSQKK